MRADTNRYSELEGPDPESGAKGRAPYSPPNTVYSNSCALAGRKRGRSPTPSEFLVDEDDQPEPADAYNITEVEIHEFVVIGDHERVKAMYYIIFCHIQEKSMKIVLKIWIKVIQQKKQSQYPYIGGEETRPNWWPKDVRHTEPDHLLKSG